MKFLVFFNMMLRVITIGSFTIKLYDLQFTLVGKIVITYFFSSKILVLIDNF